MSFRTTTHLAFTVVLAAVLALPAAASAAPIYDHGFGVPDAQPAASGGLSVALLLAAAVLAVALVGTGYAVFRASRTRGMQRAHVEV